MAFIRTLAVSVGAIICLMNLIGSRDMDMGKLEV